VSFGVARGTLAGEHLVEHGAKGEDVGAMIDVAPL
jgi:hypothetical protein